MIKYEKLRDQINGMKVDDLVNRVALPLDHRVDKIWEKFRDAAMCIHGKKYWGESGNQIRK